MDSKFFDVYEDSWHGFRIAQNVNDAWIRDYCAQHGLKITREQQRGVRYFDVFLKRT